MKKTVTIRINEETWKKVKIKAIEKNMGISEFIENMLKEKIGEGK